MSECVRNKVRIFRSLVQNFCKLDLCTHFLFDVIENVQKFNVKKKVRILKEEFFMYNTG
jgi:hypothetical protein